MPWYYINLDGDQEGPFQFQELAERFQSKQIDADTFVWHGKKVKEWSKIGDVPGLQQKLNRPLKQKLNSRGSVVDLNFPERKTSTRSRAGTVPDFARMTSTDSLGQGPGEQKLPSSLKEFQELHQSTNQDDLVKQIWHLKKSNSLRQNSDNSAMGERMVQIANLLVKTQDELERQKKENEIILNENREQKSKMADLESKLKKEMQ